MARKRYSMCERDGRTPYGGRVRGKRLDFVIKGSLVMASAEVREAK